AIIEVQKAAGLLFEPALNAWTMDAAWLIDLFNWVYFWLDFPLIVSIGLLLFFRSRFHYSLLRDALLISGGLALVMCVSYPEAPPRYLPEWRSEERRVGKECRSRWSAGREKEKVKIRDHGVEQKDS